MMGNRQYYTIGEVSKICNISTKALRYYDKIGIISPDVISEENGYRYYDRKTLLNVPVLKYYKQMGFKLEEMQELLEGSSYQTVRHCLHDKLDELKVQMKDLQDSLIAAQDWYNLVHEAELVVQNNIRDVSVKYMPGSVFCFMDQDFTYDYIESIINISWTNYLEEHAEQVTGPVILGFQNVGEKRDGTCKRCTILQQAVTPDDRNEIQIQTGAAMSASVYHIGSHDRIGETYERLEQWLRQHGYDCGTRCFERYVVDYWTTRNPEEFVTEILVPLRKL